MPRKPNVHIRSALLKWMSEHDLTPADLAERAGITNSTSVYGWLRGANAPGPDNVKRLVKLTGLPADTFRAKQGRSRPATPAEQEASGVMNGAAGNTGWAVICLSEPDPGSNRGTGPYVLATRHIFADKEEAVDYARFIAPDRKALIVEGDWRRLRID